MAKRDFEWWSCTRKTVYDTWSAAEAACRDIIQSEEYAPRGKGLHAYRCVFNDTHWHIGALTDKAQRKKRAAERELTKRRLDARLVERLEGVIDETD